MRRYIPPMLPAIGIINDHINNFEIFVCTGTNIGEKKEWGKNQPNNYIGGKREPQSCVMLHNGVWNDEQCSSQHSYICQIPFVDM